MLLNCRGRLIDRHNFRSSALPDITHTLEMADRRIFQAESVLDLVPYRATAGAPVTIPEFKSHFLAHIGRLFTKGHAHFQNWTWLCMLGLHGSNSGH